MVKNTLIDSWKDWDSSNKPYVLGADSAILNTAKNEQDIIKYSSYKNYYSNGDFGNPAQEGVHLDLLPQPYCGGLRNAEIYILLLNPGLDPTDYYGEYEVPKYRKSLLDNIAQRGNADYPFIFLNPAYSWTGGYRWWHSKLDEIIAQISVHYKISYAGARQLLSKKVASIELFPYHSKSFKNHAYVKKLESVKLAKEYVNGYVMPRVRDGRAIVIVTRQAKVWDLKKGKGVVVYPPGKARGASLGLASDGGKAIFEHLTKN